MPGGRQKKSLGDSLGRSWHSLPIRTLQSGSIRGAAGEPVVTVEWLQAKTLFVAGRRHSYELRIRPRFVELSIGESGARDLPIGYRRLVRIAE